MHPAAQTNGVAERFIRTLKENLLWVRRFATVVELVEALREFRRRYITPARKKVKNTNPTRQRGFPSISLAGASG